MVPSERMINNLLHWGVRKGFSEEETPELSLKDKYTLS